LRMQNGWNSESRENQPKLEEDIHGHGVGI
jgi:hypothetical protein